VGEIKLRKINYKRMKINAQFLAMSFMAIVLAGCANKQDRAVAKLNEQYAKVFPEFNRRYTEAQNDYCSTNIFIAEQGENDFRIWLLNTNNPTEPVINRDSALYLINGRLFLIEEHIGNTNQAERFYQESTNCWSNYQQYLQSLHRTSLEPISSKEELRERFIHMERIIDVGWRKQSKP
jgi:hypothetical protein